MEHNPALKWMADKSLQPMLLSQRDPFDDRDFIYEVKFDGIRCLAYLEAHQTTLMNRHLQNITMHYPELHVLHQTVQRPCLLDGEIICVTNGKPDFFTLQRRALTTNSLAIRLAAQNHPVQFIAYDVLIIQDESVMKEPLLVRKQKLADLICESPLIRLSTFISQQGKKLFEWTKNESLEGVVAKKKDSLYYPNKRSKDWFKMKHLIEEDLTILGYSLNEDGHIRRLVLGEFNQGWIYRGGVTGVSYEEENLIKQIKQVSQSWLDDYTESAVVWIQPHAIAVVEYMEKTSKQGMRQPALKEIRYPM